MIKHLALFTLANLAYGLIHALRTGHTNITDVETIAFAIAFGVSLIVLVVIVINVFERLKRLFTQKRNEFLDRSAWITWVVLVAIIEIGSISYAVL